VPLSPKVRENTGSAPSPFGEGRGGVLNLIEFIVVLIFFRSFVSYAFVNKLKGFDSFLPIRSYKKPIYAN
jgi:hypothetical protein